MVVKKRESRLRRWARKLGGYLQNRHPHRKYKSSSHIDIGNTLPKPLHHSNLQRTPRTGLIGQREQPSKKAINTGSRTWDSSPKRTMPPSGRLRSNVSQDIPGDETIRLVNASVSSLVAGRQGTQTPCFVGRASKQALREPKTHKTDGSFLLQGHPALLTWRESFEVQRALKRELPQPPSDRYDSAVDVVIRPLHVRKHQVQKPHYPSRLGRSTAVPVPPKPTANARTCHPPVVNSDTALSTKEKEPVRGWEYDWDRTFQHHAGNSKAFWKTTSQRLLLRNQDSIRHLDTERAIMEQIAARMELEKRQDPQMRSIKSIEEMAEEDKRADEEWNGIATQLAFDAQSPGIQEVKSVSFRHQRRPIINTRR